MNNSYEQLLTEEDPLLQLWLFFEHSFSIRTTHNVEMKILGDKIRFKGDKDNVLKCIDNLAQQQKKFKAVGVLSEDDHKLNELRKSGLETSVFEVAHLRDKFPEECERVESKWKSIVVYNKRLEMEVLGYLRETVTETLVLDAEKTLILHFINALSKGRAKFNCEACIHNTEKNIIVSIKGISSQVKEFRDYIRKRTDRLCLYLVFSPKDPVQAKYNSAQVPLLSTKLKEHEFYTIDRKKLQKMVTALKNSVVDRYSEGFLNDSGNFLMVMIEKKLCWKVEQFVEKHRRELENEINSHFSGVKSILPKGYDFRVPQSYDNNKNRNFESESYVQYPIDKMIYQGIHKFSNFKTKLSDIQSTFQVFLEPKEKENIEGPNEYVIEYLMTPDHTKIEEDLKFFFKDYRVKTLIASVSSILNLMKVSKNVKREMDEMDLFRDVVVDDFVVSNGRLEFKFYSGRQMIKEIVNNLEKMLSRVINQSIKLIEKK